MEEHDLGCAALFTKDITTDKNYSYISMDIDPTVGRENCNLRQHLGLPVGELGTLGKLKL